jgi:autoinducer 2-degrading protein
MIRLTFRGKGAPVLIQSVRYTFANGDGARAEAMFRELRDSSRVEEGVVAFDIARSAEQPDQFALWEVYRDQAALDSHMASAHFRRLVIDGVRQLAKERHGEILLPI